MSCPSYTPRKFSDNTSGDLIATVFLKEGKKGNIHFEMLWSVTDFFTEPTFGIPNFFNNHEHVVCLCLPDVELETFMLFNRWLENNEVPEFRPTTPFSVLPPPTQKKKKTPALVLFEVNPAHTDLGIYYSRGARLFVPNPAGFPASAAATEADNEAHNKPLPTPPFSDTSSNTGDDLAKNLVSARETELDAEQDMGVRMGMGGILPSDPHEIETPSLPYKSLYEGDYEPVLFPEDLTGIYEHTVKMHKLYFLAEKLDIEDLMNLSMVRIQHGVALMNVIHFSHITEAYKNTRPFSPLRIFYAQYVARSMGGCSDGFYKEVNVLGAVVPEFSSDLFSSVSFTDMVRARPAPEEWSEKLKSDWNCGREVFFV